MFFCHLLSSLPMPAPVLFVALVLCGALLLLLALTIGPRNNKILGAMLLAGILLLFVPVAWLLVHHLV